MEKHLFKDLDLNNFWKKSEYALEEYIESFPDNGSVASVERELGYMIGVRVNRIIGSYGKNILS